MIIKHRVNKIEELKQVPTKYGVEVDLRLMNGEIILAHDPFVPGEKFVDWLKNFRHEFLILNVKEDGLEAEIMGILSESGISKYFFLDQPFPTLRKSILSLHEVALRLSEYENPINLRELNIKWVWLDSFTGDWSILAEHSGWLRKGMFNLCVVSPELQGRNNFEEYNLIMESFSKAQLAITGVCTKNPEIWEKLLS